MHNRIDSTIKFYLKKILYQKIKLMVVIGDLIKFLLFNKVINNFFVYIKLMSESLLTQKSYI